MNVRHLTLAVGTLVGMVGCGRTPQIEHYQVPKQHVIDKLTGADKAAKDRMLAAMVAHGDRNWFFKLSGQSDLVSEQIEPFTALVKSVRFSDQGNPVWNLPEGWREKPGEGMRYATLEIDSNNGLEGTVTSLPRGEGVDDASYALSNVNRWRGQLSLPPIESAGLEQVATKLELEGTTALLFNFEGRLRPGGMGSGMGQPPFAGGPMAGPSPAERDLMGESSEPTYQVPEGWEELGPGPMRKAGFRVTDGDLKAEITISTAGGGLVANVNRWRGQVDLEPIDEDQVDDAAERIAVGQSRACYFRLIGPKKTILGVVTEAAGQQWFIKLMGDNPLAEREQERFARFVESIDFAGAEGAGNGA